MGIWKHFVDFTKNQSMSFNGVGGGGSNAPLITCSSKVETWFVRFIGGQVDKFELGVTLTEGLGQGANPDIRTSICYGKSKKC
jgi:hypothetical protein